MISAKLGTAIFTGFLTVQGISAYYTAYAFGRRTLILTGTFGMCIMLAAIGFLIRYERNVEAIIAMIIFSSFFMNAYTNVWPQYLSETLTDSGFTIAIATFYGSAAYMAATTEYIMAGVGVDGYFFILCGLTTIGAIFFAIVLKETKGLTDIEQKSLYSTEI